MKLYCHSLTLGTSYDVAVDAAAVNAPTPNAAGDTVSLGTKGLIFTGSVIVPSTNIGITFIQNVDDTNQILQLSPGAVIRVSQLDLSKINVKVGTSGTLGFLGQTDH